VYGQWIGLPVQDVALAALVILTVLPSRITRRLLHPRGGGARRAQALPPAKLAFDVRRLIHRIAPTYSERARSKGISFRIALAPNVPRLIRGSASHLEAVLTNLLDNAVQFTAEGVVRVEAAMTRDGRGRPCVRLRVLDTGQGIDAETLARLLQGQDAGHGLCSALRLVSEMGGRLGADSEPRGGSTFWFSVPVEVVQAARVAPPKKPQPLPAFSGDGLAPLLPRASNPSARVLVIEEDLAFQVALLWGLRTLGYLGEPASNGPAALEAWQRTPFDLVLLNRAVAGSEETARRIRGFETGCVPIVAITSQPDESAAGVDGCLHKPVCLLELARTLDRWLGAAGPAYVSEASSDRLSLPV